MAWVRWDRVPVGAMFRLQRRYEVHPRDMTTIGRRVPGENLYVKVDAVGYQVVAWAPGTWSVYGDGGAWADGVRLDVMGRWVKVWWDDV